MSEPIVSIEKKEVTLKDLILSVKSWMAYLRSQWRLIGLAVLVGAGLGLLYSFLVKRVYVAKTTFIVDESKTTNALSSLASIQLPGFNMDNKEGLFSGDNLIWLYTSDRMISETLMTRVSRGGDSVLLLNWLEDVNETIRDGVENIKKQNIGYKAISNTQTISDLSIAQRQVLKLAVDFIQANLLTVGRENPDVAIIGVSFKCHDERFAQLFTDELVERVNNFYIYTKTKQASEQVQTLEQKVSEFNQNVNQSMAEAAYATDAVPNANPYRQKLRVAPQRKIVDVQVNSEIYVTMVQQLEAAKVALARSEPLIQIIDRPALPLESHKPSKIITLIVGGIIGLLVISIILIAVKEYNRILRS